MSIRRPLILICDVQERFRSAIYSFDHMTNTIVKVLKAAKILDIPTFATEQNPRALGSSIPEIASLLQETKHLSTDPKTKFSMVNDQTKSIFDVEQYDSYILLGIESHVCVLQTALDILRPLTSSRRKGDVYVVSDGVSSCNPTEIPVALRQIENAGGVITTSESLIFRLVGNAADSNFKAIAALVKEEKSRTKEALEALPGIH